MHAAPQTFFAKDAVTLAQDLIGCTLIVGEISGIIVETEAYNQDDAASHSYKGETARTKVMFGPAGYAYIYFTYGMHYCFNVVCGPEGRGEAVLIRALEPKTGLDTMRQRRNQQHLRQLCSGPAKLVQALGITKADYGRQLFDTDDFYIAPRTDEPTIESGPRIGISRETHKAWRFWLSASEFVSK